MQANRRRPVWALAAGLMLVGTGSAQAACSIVINSHGRMVPNPAITQMSSALPGGSKATLTVTTSGGIVCNILPLPGCPTITLTPPGSFEDAPTGGNTGVSFSMSATRTQDNLLLGLVPLPLLNGIHTLTIDLTASRASGVFPAGGYEALVNVLCE